MELEYPPMVTINKIKIVDLELPVEIPAEFEKHRVRGLNFHGG